MFVLKEIKALAILKKICSMIDIAMIESILLGSVI
jgi:hypothetical protein